MCEMKPSTKQKHFGAITDPRTANKRHLLIDIISISICAVVCGASTYEQIVEFGKEKFKWLDTFLELPNGIPSHDTFGRVFSRIDPREFQNSFMKWVEDVSHILQNEIIAIDGKTLRRSHDHASGKKPIHMVNAWATDSNIVLGQYKTEEKSNEITAIPLLLKMLDISGTIITIDAMGCQTKIASKIIEKKADYVLSLKENHPTMYENTKLYLDDKIKSGTLNTDYHYHETLDGDHGRIETRKYWITSVLIFFRVKNTGRD